MSNLMIYLYDEILEEKNLFSKLSFPNFSCQIDCSNFSNLKYEVITHRIAEGIEKDVLDVLGNVLDHKEVLKIFLKEKYNQKFLQVLVKEVYSECALQTSFFKEWMVVPDSEPYLQWVALSLCRFENEGLQENDEDDIFDEIDDDDDNVIEIGQEQQDVDAKTNQIDENHDDNIVLFSDILVDVLFSEEIQTDKYFLETSQERNSSQAIKLEMFLNIIKCCSFLEEYEKFRLIKDSDKHFTDLFVKI